MSEGLPWVDRLMRPFGSDGLNLPVWDYNRIYEAVARGDEAEGKLLVIAILHLAMRVKNGHTPATDLRLLADQLERGVSL